MHVGLSTCLHTLPPLHHHNSALLHFALQPCLLYVCCVSLGDIVYRLRLQPADKDSAMSRWAPPKKNPAPSPLFCHLQVFLLL
jgi:hypothetical protein